MQVEKIWTEIAENEPKTFTADAKQRSLSHECLYGDLSSRKSEPPPRLAYIPRVMAAAMSYNRTKSPREAYKEIGALPLPGIIASATVVATRRYETSIAFAPGENIPRQL